MPWSSRRVPPGLASGFPMSSTDPSVGSFPLPGGLLLADGRRLEQAELRPLTVYEEEWLAAHLTAPNTQTVTRLLESCLLSLDGISPTPEMVGQLLVGDRDYLVLQLRRITLGDQIQAVFACPACSARMDVDFSLADVPVERRPQSAACHSLELENGRRLHFHLPTGADQQAILAVEAGERVSALLARCLEEAALPLTQEELEKFSAAMERLAPQVDLELDLTCPECNHTFTAPFDLTAFFFSEMQANAVQLLREVHFLAFYYHWSEENILKLTRKRRREYLALLNETLRTDG